MQLPILTWIATTNKDYVNTLDTKEKEDLAEQHIRQLLRQCGYSHDTRLDRLTPEICFDVWQAMRRQMGIGDEGAEVIHQTAEKEPFATKLKRTISKVFTCCMLPFAKRAVKTLKWFLYKAAQR